MVVVVVQSRPALFNCMNAVLQASLSFIISWNLLKLMSIESLMPLIQGMRQLEETWETSGLHSPSVK